MIWNMTLSLIQMMKMKIKGLALKDRREGFFSIRKVGEPDFCNNGCVIVDDIRVPFPDCFRHANQFTRDAECGTMGV